MDKPPHRQGVASLLRSPLCAKLQVCLRLEPLSEERGERFKHFQQFASEPVFTRALDTAKAYLSTCFGGLHNSRGCLQTCIFAQLALLLDTNLHFCTENIRTTRGQSLQTGQKRIPSQAWQDKPDHWHLFSMYGLILREFRLINKAI